MHGWKSGLRIQKEYCHDRCAALNVFALSPLPPLLSHTLLVFSRSHITGTQRDEIETEFVSDLSSAKIRLTCSEIAEMSSTVIEDQTYKNSSTKLTRAMCERQYRDTIEKDFKIETESSETFRQQIRLRCSELAGNSSSVIADRRFKISAHNWRKLPTGNA